MKKQKHKPTIDRGAVMRAANKLMKQTGMSRSDAMRAAWASAKGSLPAQRQPKQQQGGARAALRRYGVDADALAARAAQAVNEIAAAAAHTARKVAAAIAIDRPALLPPPVSKSIDLTRGSDGVYR